MGIVNLPHLPTAQLRLTTDEDGHILRLGVVVDNHELAQLPISGLSRENDVGDHARMSIHMFQQHLKVRIVP